MEVARCFVDESRGRPDRVRLCADIVYDDDHPGELWWFEVSADLLAEVSVTGNPWLVAALPLAATLGEPLRVRRPVDPRLVEGVRRITEIWSEWYPELRPVEIEAESIPEAGPDEPRSGVETAAFFSGGLDSSFTVLRDRARLTDPANALVETLVSVLGFDVPWDEPAALRALEVHLSRFARDAKKNLVTVETNLRGTRWGSADWGRVAHGCGLAACALALEHRFAQVYVPSTGGTRDPHPWGSHPATDPLFSTSCTEFVHDGAEKTRVEKARAIADAPEARNGLRVCWRSGTHENCGECSKCYRTMAILDVLGELDGFITFSASRVTEDDVARIYCAEPWDFRELSDLRALAHECGRAGIASGAERAMRTSRRLARQLDWVRRMRRSRSFDPLSRGLERRLLRGRVV